MNSTGAVSEGVAATRKSRAWFYLLVLIPLLTAGLLFLLREVEVRHLAAHRFNDYGAVPAFQLTNQNGQPFGSADLAGKIWIADFIYTTCPGPCPMISSRMSEMQRPLENTDVHFVSFSVDPEKDTPAVLRGYAERLQAQPGRWDFLTGLKSTIYDLSVHGFKLAAGEHDGENGEPLHSTRMILVDRRGQIRGYYDATAPDTITKLIADASRLAKEQPR